VRLDTARREETARVFTERCRIIDIAVAEEEAK
jgi:hypothetical protein